MTDKDISAIWVVIPLLVSFAGAIIGSALMVSEMLRMMSDLMLGIVPPDLLTSILLGLTIIVISVIVALVIFGMLTYMLIQRQNEHFQREAQLRMGILSYLRGSAGSPEREATIAAEIATINSLHVQAMQEERPHSSIGWALFIVLATWLPIVNIILLLYLFYFLMRNMDTHDTRWNMFLQQTGFALAKLGHNTDAQAWYSVRLPQRSFVLYVVLSIITLGLFVYYWWYILIRNPNEHFKMQAFYEDRIAETISH